MRFSSLLKGGILLQLLLVAPACGRGEPGAGGGARGNESTGGSVEPETIPLEDWALSDTPILEIGVREGEEAYQLHRVQGSLRLRDGRVVVLNGGSQELRYYDSAGRFITAVGRRGEGPGEFQFPAGLRRTEDGGLLVWDRGLMRTSFLDLDGTFRESVPLLASRDELFPGDDWLLGQNWIVSPVPPGARDPIRRAVEALPSPDSVGVLRLVRVTHQGRIWVPGELPPSDTPVTWDIYDLRGKPTARITTPARFHLHEIGEEYVTGVFLDEMDVNYVRVYRIRKPSGSPPGPGLDLTSSPAPKEEDTPPPPPPAEVMAEIRSLLKNMASLEEIHYAGHYSYTADTDVLFADPRARVPDGLVVDILFAGPEGWAAMVTHPGSGGRCVMAYGFFVPMGWQPGSLICF